MSKKLDPVLLEVIKKCRVDPAFFIESFCKIEHPSAGIIPFRLWGYQRRCLKSFKENRFNIFRKCRQSGISTLTGAFALWLAMFYNNKTILIVSKRDDDAKNYLRRNVKLIYENLPEWMRAMWVPMAINEHTLSFTNGSIIRSLTSSPDTLRSHASSLNIIDEAAFIDKMEVMWLGGWSTLQHGGSAIIISTPKGVSNWYYKTWRGAINGSNGFNPININWWDMDWKIEYLNPHSKNISIICPTSGLKALEKKEDVEKYGPYWSPWLEEQYRELTSKGGDTGFRQEVLAEFIGTGETVLSRNALLYVQKGLSEVYQTIGKLDYYNPANEDRDVLDFEGRLRVWKPPYKGDPKAPDLIDRYPHIYVLGADPAGGESHDFSAIQIFDITTQEQVAELQIRVLPRIFAKMIDLLGRMYNQAMVVCERTGMGQPVCQDLDHYICYPNLYRQKRNSNTVGFPTTSPTKHILVKQLVDNVGENGYQINSDRLYDEFTIFVNLPNGRYGAEPGTGNTDDLVMATALAMVGIENAIQASGSALIPIHSMGFGGEGGGDVLQRQKEFASLGGKNAMLPINVNSEAFTGKAKVSDELARFTMQLGGIPVQKETRQLPNGQIQDSVSMKKNILKFFRR